jgi:hypothetical protein
LDHERFFGERCMGKCRGKPALAFRAHAAVAHLELGHANRNADTWVVYRNGRRRTRTAPDQRAHGGRFHHLPGEEKRGEHPKQNLPGADCSPPLVPRHSA